MIVAVEEAHHVGGDELAVVRVGADDVELIFLVAAPGVGDEALPAEEETGVAAGGFDRDLRPVVVGFAPVGGGPFVVEVVEGAVAGFEPVVEAGLVGGAVGFVGVFVVDLPADDVGIVAEAFGELLGHGAGKLTIFRVGPVELLAVAVLVGAAVFFNAEGFGILGGEPGGRRGGGRSDDDGDVVTGSCVNRALKPVEIVLAFGGFEFGPGEFADADEADVGGFHEGEVGVPAGFGPLLGIPGGAEVECWGIGDRRGGWGLGAEDGGEKNGGGEGQGKEPGSEVHDVILRGLTVGARQTLYLKERDWAKVLRS